MFQRKSVDDFRLKAAFVRKLGFAAGVDWSPQFEVFGPRPLCLGQPATMAGTDAADHIVGTPGDDVMPWDSRATTESTAARETT